MFVSGGKAVRNDALSAFLSGPVRARDPGIALGSTPVVTVVM